MLRIGGSVVGLRHFVLSLKVADSIHYELTEFFNLPNPSSPTVAMGSTQPLTEMSTRNLPANKEWPAGA
jgi:hypothetical protein